MTLFWKKAVATDFERAVGAYYKCCKRNGSVPIKPSEQHSEICDSHIILRDQFMLIAKIFFLAKEQASENKKIVSPSGSYVLKLQ